MKSLFRVFAWILISIFLQGGIYLFLDKLYFVDERNVKITQLNESEIKHAVTAELSFPQNSSGIELSYDGSYTSYFDGDNNFVLAETATGRIINIPFKNGAKCISFKWLPDSNIIILVESLQSKKRGKIRFYSYDVVKGIKKDIGDPANNECSISINASDINVELQVSILTGVMYIKVTRDSESKLYRIDRNETMTKVSTKSNAIGSFQIASHDDLLAYVDMDSNVIRTTAEKKKLEIDGSTELFLLGADGNDNIYVGNKNGDGTSKIFYGKLSDDVTAWNNITLEKSVDPQKIIVTYDGDLYLNSGLGTLENLKDKSTITYKGDFIGIYGGQVASKDNGKLILKNP